MTSYEIYGHTDGSYCIFAIDGEVRKLWSVHDTFQEAAERKTVLEST